MDGWESSKSSAPRKKVADVPDEWDADDDNNEGETADPSEAAQRSENATLWQQAEASGKMPEIVLQANSSSMTSGASAAAILPLEPKMRILKRPSSNSPTPQATPPASSTIKDREAAYAAARERIFNSPSPSPALGTSSTDPLAGAISPASQSASQPSSTALASQSTPASDAGTGVRIAREPAGPDPAEHRGFRRRTPGGSRSIAISDLPDLK